MGDTFTNGSLVNHDDEVYLDKIMTHRWPNGQKKCEVCRVMRTHVRIPGRTAYACQRCRHQIYPLAETIFEGSKTAQLHPEGGLRLNRQVDVLAHQALIE